MSGATQAPRCWAVVPAAGSGQRMGAAQPKQYLPLAGATVLEHALRPFLQHSKIAGIAVALAAGDRQWETLPCAKHSKVLRAAGGAQRMDSVLNGLVALEPKARADDWVLVHDAARPCLRLNDLERLIAAVYDDSVGGLLAVPLADTLKRSDEQGRVSVSTVDRHGLWCAQTPQMFRFAVLKDALQDAAANAVAVTDEAAAIERQGLTPRLIPGAAHNIKITRPEDLNLAAALLAGVKV